MADLAVIGPVGLQVVNRPDPPGELTDEQADEWCAIINSHAAEWLTRDKWGLLIAYCRHVVSQRYIAQLADENRRREDDFDLDREDKLLKMQERESRCMASLAVRLGIAQTTLYEKKANRKSPVKPPWQAD